MGTNNEYSHMDNRDKCEHFASFEINVSKGQISGYLEDGSKWLPCGVGCVISEKKKIRPQTQHGGENQVK